MTSGRLANRKRSRKGKLSTHLADGQPGEDLVHQQGRAFRHAAGTTAGAKTTPFTAESDQAFGVTGLALDTKKAIL